MAGLRTSINRGVVAYGPAGRSPNGCRPQSHPRHGLPRNAPHRLLHVGAEERSRAPVATASVAPTDATTVADLELVNQSNYYDYLRSAGDELVVVDFYTDWCGPCKMIYPELVKMAGEYEAVHFVKFKITKENKELGKALGVRVAPTFFLYRSSRKVADMTGARVEKLRALVEEHRK